MVESVKCVAEGVFVEGKAKMINRPAKMVRLVADSGKSVIMGPFRFTVAYIVLCLAG